MNRGIKKFVILMLVTILVFTSVVFYPEQVSAATPETRYLTIKHDDFSTSIDIDGNIPGKGSEKWLQRNGVAALVTDDSNRNVLRVTPNSVDKVGSAFYGDLISFGKERSFSTYFSFRMNDTAKNTYDAGDGLVFSIQTLSKEAGAKGGGMGYGGLTRSFGIEYDTFANPSAPRDPKAISVNSGGTPNSLRTGSAILYDTSHIAIVADGNVDHSASTTSPKGKSFPASIDTNSNPNIIGTPAVGETAAIANLKTADSGTWATNNAYPLYNGEIYHTWIVYNGPTDTMEVYLGKDANFSASKLKIKKSGIGLREYLEQDEAYVGFTAATASAFEKHDILQWYLTNNDLPIEPQNTDYTYVVAPPMIEITSTDFVTYGAVTSTTSRIVEAKLLNYDGTTWNKGPYPVTFSMFKEEAAKSYTIKKTDGTSQTVLLKPRTDDNRISLKGEQKRVNSDGSSMRYATVMSDENGIATIQISNMLSTDVNDSNVKAIVGDHFGNGKYGGGAFSYKPVTFAADIAPPTISSAGVDVSNPNHVKVLLSEYAIYPLVTNQPENWVTNNQSTWNTGGFTILIPDKDNPGSSIRVPTMIVGGSGAPGEPLLLELANHEVVPHGLDVQLEYMNANGSIQDVATNLMINQTILIDDYPFIPKGAVVINNQARKTVEVNFDFPVLANNVVPGSFSLYYDNGSSVIPVTVTGVTSDASDSKKLLLTLNSAIPAGATVTINYNIPSTGGKITNVFTSGLGTGHHTMKQLTDFSVVNQMAPIKAVVVNDNARNKVKVSFASEVELQGTVATLASALKIGINSQIELIDVSNIIVDSSDVTGKTLILTLSGPHLPTEGVPFGNIVQLDYDSTIANVDVREKTGSKRNLEWLSHFPVQNQYKLNVVIVGPVDGTMTNNKNIVVTGTSDPGKTVTITVNDEDGDAVAGVTVVDPATGIWTFTPSSALTDGVYLVTAQVSDTAGNEGSASSTFTVDTVAPNVAIVGPADGVTTNDKNTVVTGTSDPGTTVTVTVYDKNGDPIVGTTVVVPATGSWTFTPTAPLTDGEYSVTVEGTDPSGNKGTDSSTFTVDTVAPNVAIVGPADGVTTNDPNTVVTGTSDPGTTVIVTVYDKNGDPIVGTTVVVPATGSWTFTPTAPLTDGEYSVTVEGTDPSGNKGTDSSTFTVDTVAPNVAIVGPADGVTTNNQNTVVTGTSDLGVTVTVAVYDKDGDTVPGTTVVDPVTGNWTFTPSVPLVDDEYAVTVEATDSSGNIGTDNSKFTVNTQAAVSYFISLKASPDMLVADGKSISVLTAIVTDNHGNLISNVDVDFSALIQNTLTPKGTFVDNLGNVIVSRVTTYNGIAMIIFKSEAINSIIPVRIEIKAVVHDLVHGIHADATISIVFEPAVVSGVITDGQNHKPVVGAIVTLLDVDGLPIPGHTSITDADGKYSIPVTEGNKDYWISVTRTIGTGSNEQAITYRQKVMVNDDITGIGQEFVSDQTIAGIIAGKSQDGTVQPIDFGTFVTHDTAELHPMFAVFLKDGSNYVTSSKGTVAEPSESDGFSIDGYGGFVAGGLTAGTTYDLEVRYYYDVKTEKGVVRDYYIVIARKQISISKNGEMNINEELIDPFGIITDSVTHLPIANAQVILKYANTKRNRDKGITPGTSVVLPGLVGFPPANNANPQFSDTNGNYAYMVYGNTDYIIEAKATGYEDYSSVVIGIDNDIVRWDFQMKPITKDSGSTSNSGNNGGTGGSNNTSVTPPMVVSKPDVSINIVTERSTYEEGSEAPFVIIYKNEANQLLSSGQIIITLPDNVMVIDADGGIVKGNTITWEVKDLATGQSGSHQIRLKFPTSDSAEKVVSINGQFVVKGELVHPLNAIASVKVMLFSNRFGNVQHIRYILGYPDHTFKPEKSLTRAELATIIARLIGEYDEEVTMKYSDVPQKFWASSYIQTVTRHNIFTGYLDGSFHPNAPVTREELAVVMVRFLKLDISQPIETHFADAKDRWSSSSIEALYRNRLITGYPNGTFKPSNSITRREAVTMINHMLFRGPLANISPSFPDVPSTSWGFGDIEEATRSHESKFNTDGSEEYIKSIRDNVQ